MEFQKYTTGIFGDKIHTSMPDLRRCTKCIMPETKPGISFDERGVCNACQNAINKDQVDWHERMKLLRNMAEDAKLKKPKGYNCLIPVSGGKDSTFLSVTARDTLGLNPLCVFVEPCYCTERGDKNAKNLSKLGFDIFRFNPNQKIMPTLLKRSYLEDGQPVRAFEFMLYSVPMQMAINFNIPLAIWGENAAREYGNEGNIEADEQKNCPALEGQDATHWISEGVEEKDLTAFQHPTAEEFKQSGVKVIYMSDYVNWDSRITGEFAIKRGLTVRTPDELLGTGAYWDFEQLDDEIPIISHLLKFIKFGYGRATDQACRDIRNGHMTREEGLRLAAEYDGQINPEYIRRYCDYIGITVREFWEIAERFRR